MGILDRLLGRNTSVQDPKKTVITEDIEKVLVDLKSSDLSVRMTAMATAARLLGMNEPGALRPFLLGLKDEESLVRKSVTGMLATAANDQILKQALRSAVRDSEEGHQLIDLLRDMSERDSEEFVREDAKRAAENILQCLEE
jgi:hypothetical protein